jgi:hypothetical protein
MNTFLSKCISIYFLFVHTQVYIPSCIYTLIYFSVFVCKHVFYGWFKQTKDKNYLTMFFSPHRG